MGGTINMKSKPGKGTAMVMVFPAETCPETSLMQGEDSSPNDALSAGILIGTVFYSS